MEAPAAAPELAEARTSRATEAPVPAPSLEASASPGAPPMVLVNEAPAPAALATSPLACGVAAATPTRRVTSKARARAIVDSARARDDQVGRRAPPPPPPEVVASTPTARGAVSLVLPGRDGTPVVIPGYRLGSDDAPPSPPAGENELEALRRAVRRGRSGRAVDDVTADAIIEHAEASLGMEPRTCAADRALLWIAEDALDAPVPRGWHCEADPTHNTPFYYSDVGDGPQWEHPLEREFVALFVRRKAAGPPYEPEPLHSPPPRDEHEPAPSGSDDDEPHAPAYARRVRELDNEPRAAAAIDDARARLRAAAAFDDERARDHEDAQLLDELCAELAFDPETRPEAASRDRVDALDDDSPRGEGPRHMGETYRDHQRDARTEDEDDVFECALRARVRHARAPTHARFRRARSSLTGANRALRCAGTRGTLGWRCRATTSCCGSRARACAHRCPRLGMPCARASTSTL